MLNITMNMENTTGSVSFLLTASYLFNLYKKNSVCTVEIYEYYLVLLHLNRTIVSAQSPSGFIINDNIYLRMISNK